MFPDTDHTTKCTECGYAIPPMEIVRSATDRVRCPKCGKDFAPERKG